MEAEEPLRHSSIGGNSMPHGRDTEEHRRTGVGGCRISVRGRLDGVDQAAAAWESETLFTWAVCEPTTGELVATVSVILDDDRARLVGDTRDGYDDALASAYPVVARFATGALGVKVSDPQT